MVEYKLMKIFGIIFHFCKRINSNYIVQILIHRGLIFLDGHFNSLK